MTSAHFIYLLFDRSDPINGERVTVHSDYLPITDEHPYPERWAMLRAQHNSDTVHFQDVDSILDVGDPEDINKQVRRAKHFAIMGAKCTVMACLQAERDMLEKRMAA